MYFQSFGIGLHRFSAESATRPQVKQMNLGLRVNFFISSKSPLLANMHR
jgi:hypothetical protein